MHATPGGGDVQTLGFLSGGPLAFTVLEDDSMTHRVRGAFGRLGAAAFATVLASALFAGSLAAQGSTGKIEGSVTDQAGVPIANAQVFIVGTSFGAVTNDKGYYFINNVPVGTYTLRAQFIGYQPTELTNARVLGGQTGGFPVKMTASAAQVGVINVTAAANPILPRDQGESTTTGLGSLLPHHPADVWPTA